MNEAISVIEQIKPILDNPWLMLFSLIWIIGYMLKNHTTLCNNYIPWVLVLIGSVFGFLLIEQSIGGVVVGLAVAYAQIGVYSQVRNTQKLKQ